MLVAEMSYEPYEKISNKGTNEFSLTLGWTIDENFLKSTFFRARFVNWTQF
jgi:hypothetical protein